MSILDSIYKSSSQVAGSLNTTANTLTVMSKFDKKDYEEDNKFRKYQKERDKRDRQDRKKVVQKITTSLDDNKKSLKENENTGGGGGMAMLAAGLATAIAKAIKKNGLTNNDSSESSTDTDVEDVEVQGFQSGGFAGAVPNMGQPSTGDHFYTGVEPGSYIMNRNLVSAMGFQSGGTVPVALEQGEIALPPGTYDRATMDFMNYQAFPRFQQGGAVGDAKDTGEGTPVEEAAPSPTVDPETIKPGGRLEFIGNGSGWKGKFVIFDGAGKKIAEYMAASGNATTSGTSQEERKKVTGKNYPLPDGTYPLMGYTPHPGHHVGDWSDYINNEGGSVGSRSELLIHTDLGMDGTAGCVGVQLDGSRNDKEKKFVDIYKKVQPKQIKVNLLGPGQEETGDTDTDTSATGTTTTDTTNTDTNDTVSEDPLAGAGMFGAALKQVFSSFDQQMGLNQYGMSAMGILFGDPFMGLGGGGGEAATNDDSNDETQTSNNNVGGDTIIDASASLKEIERKALNIIGKYESDSVGGYNAVNQGGTNAGRTVLGYSGDISGMPQHSGKQLTEMTLREIMKLQHDDKSMSMDQWIKSGKLHAVGRYQFIGPTFKNTVKSMGLDLDQKYSKLVQDKMALHLLRTSENGIGQWVGPSDRASSQERSVVSQARQLKQRGGEVASKAKGIEKLSNMIKEEVANFFQQSDLQNQYIAMNGEPQVIFAGGGSSEEEQTGSISMMNSANNLPNYNIPARDNCPLSMFYMYNPSFNPMGIGVQ